MFCVWLIGWRVSRFRCKREATASATWSATPLDACRTSKAACRVCNRWWISSTTNPPSSAPVSPNSNSSSIRNRENPLQPPEVPIDFFFTFSDFCLHLLNEKKIAVGNDEDRRTRPASRCFWPDWTVSARWPTNCAVKWITCRKTRPSWQISLGTLL